MISAVGNNPEHAAPSAAAARSSMFSLAARSRSAKGGSGTKVQKQRRTAFEPSAGAFQGLPPENHAATGGHSRRGSMCKIEWNCYFSRIYPSSPDRISPAVCDSVCHRLLLYPSG